MEPSDFGVILWDFDGVIIDSNDIREFGFRETLKNFNPEEVEQLIEFHRVNGGWSRYIKFRYFYEEILKQPVNDKQIQKLASNFASIMLNLLPNQKFLIEQTVSFIKKMYSYGREMHIVSGSDESELMALCKELSISQYFVSINGSPTPKSKLVEKIVRSSTKTCNEFCLIGDAINDYHAAQENGIKFFGFNNEDLRKYGVYIDNF